MEKNPKACEPCRRRKVRCDGKTPCNKCEKHPEACTYRLRTRVRKSRKVQAASPGSRDVSGSKLGGGLTPGAGAAVPPDAGVLPRGHRITETLGPASSSPSSNLYQGVAAVSSAHEHEGRVERPEAENSRLFYGPASQFAFLQQIHRGVSSSLTGQGDRDVQEGGAGLDLFLQRKFFFGTASRIDTSNILGAATTLFPHVSFDQARVFLDNFKAWSSRLLPFFTNTELDQMLDDLYSSNGHVQSRPSQNKALTLAVLANGALATPHTNTAETLLARAKCEAVLFDDTVSLQMIQFSMLVADYQTGMGRPNLVYLSLGTACRKAFALGLHREAANCLTRPGHMQNYRATLWSLYTLETWFSMTVGREASLKMDDISTPFPDDQGFLVTLSRLAHIIEKLRTTIYNQRYDSLRKLYQAAEEIHRELRFFAEKFGIGGAQEPDGASPLEPTSLMLYNLFHHSVILLFRPFLVADYALASSHSGQHTGGGGADALWLRHACRTAIDAAQDQILHAQSQIQKHEACRASRYNGFFYESSSSVILFDILRHPSKYTYNVEYINMALQSLDSMIDDEPVTNARNSIRQILRVVEDTISKRKSAGLADSDALTDPQLSQDPALPSPASFLDTVQPDQQPGANATSSWFNSPDKPLIYFPDLGSDAIDPLLLPYDVMATDLYSFFPLNMSPPSAAEGESSRTGPQS